MKIYVKTDLYFYVRNGEGVASVVSETANIMDYAGKTLFVSDKVRIYKSVFFHNVSSATFKKI